MNDYTINFERQGKTIVASVSSELIDISKTFKGRRANEKAIDWVYKQIEDAEKEIEAFRKNLFSWNENS